MLLGSVEVADPKEIMKLDELEKTLSQRNEELDRAKQTFQTTQTSDCLACRSLLKTLVGISERCMTGLERADSVYLPTADEKQRNRRKALVNSFQVILNEVEKMQTELEKETKTAAIIEINK
ncbi:hypothetical protein AAHC03_05611 [Spirometra sp. Aus1]